MPNQSAINSLKFLALYNDLVEALANFNRWGLKIQTIATTMQNDQNYTVILTNGERTALTNFLNSINSIIPINNIPNKVP